jgi:hypothetical protein
MGLTPKQRKAVLEKGLLVNLASPSDEAKYLAPNPKAATQLFAKGIKSTEKETELPADGRPEALPADRELRQTVDRKHYRQTVRRSYRQTLAPDSQALPLLLPADRESVVSVDIEEDYSKSIPLAPVQWTVWQVLLGAQNTGKIVSYRMLAQLANASIRGVRDALDVIQREGGIRRRETVRNAQEQGLSIELNHTIPFRSASLTETKALLKRGSNYRQTVDRKSSTLPVDGLRMYVSKYIRHTDIEEFLRLFPSDWAIREGTLKEIIREFPNMTTFEFRRSLLYLVNQARTGRQPIQNHNAWLKAAFSRNGGPLITERMIEAQLDTLKKETKAEQGRDTRETADPSIQEDFDALRQYLGASADIRATIERTSQERAAPALRMTPTEKHAEIIQQALIDTARELFMKKTGRVETD